MDSDTSMMFGPIPAVWGVRRVKALLLTTLFQYSMCSVEWSQLASGSFLARRDHSCVINSAGNTLYIIAGETGTAVLSDIWAYNLTSREFLSQLPKTSKYHSCVVETDMSLSSGTFPGRRRQAAAFDYTKNLIYIVAGVSTVALSDIWSYAISTGNYTYSSLYSCYLSC